MTISFLPYVFDTTRDLWIIPPAVDRKSDDDDLEMNVGNENGADLLLALGLNPDPNFQSDPMPIERFSALVTSALRRHLGHRSPKLESVTDREPGRCTIIDLGRREGYIEERLGQLATLVQRSRAAGGTHMGWG